MMVKWSDTKYLLSSTKFLGDHLKYDGEDLEDIDSRDDDEDDERIGHHSYDGEIGSEGESSSISHIKFSRFDIVPEKSDESSDDDHTEGSEDKESLIIADKCVYGVVEKQESSRESIESIGDIDRVGHGDDNEYKKGDIEHSEIKAPEKRYLD